MVSLLVGIPLSVDCNEAVDASSMLTCETPPPLPAAPPTRVGGFVRTVDAFRSE